MKRFRQILESVDPITEAIAASAKELAKEIDAAARRETGQDKKDYMNVAKLIAANKYKEAAKFMSKLDTMPLEDLVVLIMGHEDVFKVMYPKARPGQFVANFARESVDEALEFHVRLDRLDRDKRSLDKVNDLLKKHERAGHISFEYETDKGVVYTAKSKSYIDAVRKDVETKPYYALVDFSESVELDEAFKKGDSVTVKNARKYDSLSKPEVSGTVIGMIGSKVMVKVGSGQMNVDPKDLVKESVELDEGKYQKYSDLLIKKAKLVAQGPIASKEVADINKQIAAEMKNLGVKEEVEFDEAFTPKDVKMAIGVASDKRYAGGNMTGAVNAIEKIKKGLSDHPQVKAVLKKQNESDELEEAAVKVIPEKLPRMNRDEKDIADTLTKAGLVYGKVNKFDSGKFIDPKTGVSITIMRNGNAVAASSADGGTLLSPTDPSNLKAFLKKRGLIESPAIEEALSPAEKEKRLKMIRQAVEKINKNNAELAKKDALRMMKDSGMFDD